MRPRPAALGTAAVAATVIALLPFTLSGYHQALAAQVAVFFIAILGLNVLTGYTGQISIGHGAFMAIGGYTTAVLSRDHHMSLVLTILVAFAICFVLRPPGRAAGPPAVGRLSRARDLRPRRLRPADPAPVLEVPRRERRRPVGDDARASPAVRRRAGRQRRSCSCSPGSSCADERAARSARSATARWPRRPPASSWPSTRRLRSGSRPRSPESAGSLFVMAHERIRAAERVRDPPLAPDPRRRGHRRPRLALGRARGRRVRGPAAHHLERRAGDRVDARPGRRLRPARDPRHAPAPDRGRRTPPPDPAAAGPDLTLGSISPI